MLRDKDIQQLKRSGVPTYKNIFPPNTKNIFDDKLVGLIGEANRRIGNLNSYARIIPNPDLLVGPLLLKEALASSKIEGTQASIRDILKKDADVKSSANLVDVNEVINYREATNLGWKMLEEIPISIRLLKNVHNRLMEGEVRGREKTRGAFRVGQNAIGREGDLSSIKYLPPPTTEVDKYMAGLEKYINDEQLIHDKLVKCAFIHYEFEAIHPFADGNGRVGRVLITLYLLKEDVLKYPLIYPSAYFLHFKEEYERRLMNITVHEDWKGWLEFFLKGMIEQADKSEKLIEKIDQLYQSTLEIVRTSSKSVHGAKFVETVFKMPIIQANDVAEILHVNHATAMSLLKNAAELGIISYDSRKRKNIPFINSKLINLLEDF